MHQAKIWTRLHRTTCTHLLAFFFPFCNGRNAALPLLFLVFFFGRSLRRCVTSTWKWPAFFLLLSHSLSLIYRNADTSAAGHHHRHHLLSRQAAYTERHVSKAIARIKIYIYFLSLTFLFFLCAIVFFFFVSSLCTVSFVIFSFIKMMPLPEMVEVRIAPPLTTSYRYS